MKTLAGRLLLAFVAIIVVYSAVTIAVARRTTSNEIRHVMFMSGGRMEMIDADTLRSELAQSYAASGDWEEGVRWLAQSSGHMSMMGGAVILAQPDGTIIAGAPSGRLSTEARAQSLPITVDEELVGLLFVSNAPPMATPVVETVVARVNRAVWLATLAAGGLAFGLALMLVRTISRPLANLATAAQAVAAGDLTARVPDGGPAEIRGVAHTFNRMADTLAQQETLRQAMLADVAHELRTPLAVMQGQIEALEDGIFPATPEHLAPLRTQTVYLARMVEDLRTLAHADAGQLRLERVPVSLQSLVADLLSAITPEAAAKGITLTREIPDELPPLDADPVRLRQVLVNLVSNALRHTQSGGTITVRARLDDGAVVIVVADTGEGISPDDLPHVFDRFYRTDRSRSRATGGSGLGLAIARRLTESHGGRITMTSELGQGTAVTLIWPLWSA